MLTGPAPTLLRSTFSAPSSIGGRASPNRSKPTGSIWERLDRVIDRQAELEQSAYETITARSLVEVLESRPRDRRQTRALLYAARDWGRRGVRQRTSQRSFDLVNCERHIGVSVDDDGRIIFSRIGGGPNNEMIRDASASTLQPTLTRHVLTPRESSGWGV